MTIISDAEFADFLTDKPLYAKVTAATTADIAGLKFENPADYKDKPFKFLCPREKEIHTFRTGLVYNNHLLSLRFDSPKSDPEQLPVNFDERTQGLDITTHVTGLCQSCGAQINFLIRAFSDKTWDKRKEGLSVILQKIGQYPAFDIQPDKEVQKYLTDEDLGFYKKALTNLSVSYGIGAFAYFRRIIENEIKRIIKDLSELEFEGADTVREAYRLFEQNHQMAALITSINAYLPRSMFIGGENPIQLLYQQLSAGIHQEPDETCLEKAEMINIVLPFVIRKVNEEKHAAKDVAAAMKKLKSL
jgi:hypothetical protein